MKAGDAIGDAAAGPVGRRDPPGPWERGAAVLLRWADRALMTAAGLALVATMAVTAADVVLRLVGRSIAGSFEIIGWLAAAAMALALGHAQRHRSHVAVTLLSDRLRGRAAAALDLGLGLASLALFALIAFHVVEYGRTLQQTGSLSETLKVAVYPWVYVVGVGFAGLVMMLAADVAAAIRRLARPAPPASGAATAEPRR